MMPIWTKLVFLDHACCCFAIVLLHGYSRKKYVRQHDLQKSNKLVVAKHLLESFAGDTAQEEQNCGQNTTSDLVASPPKSLPKNLHLQTSVTYDKSNTRNKVYVKMLKSFLNGFEDDLILREG